MSANVVPAPTSQPPLPNLPCPNCGKNLLADGFYNSCTETTLVHEENRTYIVKDHLYMDNDEETLDTIDHECDLEAYCRGCEKLLPWRSTRSGSLTASRSPKPPA